MGSALCVSPSSRGRQASPPGAERRAEGAPNVPDKEGGSGRGDEVPPSPQNGGGRKHGLRPVCESVFPRPPGLASGAERRAEGAPNVPDKEGVPEGGTKSPLAPSRLRRRPGRSGRCSRRTW